MEAGVSSWALGGGGGISIEGLSVEESINVKFKTYLTQGRMWKGLGKKGSQDRI